MKYEDPYAPPVAAERRGIERGIIAQAGKCPECGGKLLKEG